MVPVPCDLINKAAKTTTPCRRACSQMFSEADRLDLFNAFWDLGENSKQNEYLSRCIETVPIARERPKDAADRKTARSVAVKFFLTIHGRKIQCCKRFLIATLGIGRGKIDYLLQNLNANGSPKEDRRGKARITRVAHEEKKDRIRDHIRSFKHVPSHYCRKSSKRQYLPSDLNLSLMFKMYKDGEAEPLKESTYRKIFNGEFNLAFHEPKKDRCGLCYKYEHGDPKERQKLEAIYQTHIIHRDRSRYVLENAKNTVEV